MQTRLAHALSIAGHPAILVPVAAALSAVTGGAPPELARMAAIVACGVAAVVVLYSLVQVRRGKWVDADASVPGERGELNLFLAPVLAAGAAWAGWSGQPLALVAGLGLAAGLAAIALASSRWLKLSLHTAFAVFGACLFWPQAVYAGLGLGAAALIAWSRLHLKRHTLADVAAGAAAGLTAGAAFVILTAAP